MSHYVRVSLVTLRKPLAQPLLNGSLMLKADLSMLIRMKGKYGDITPGGVFLWLYGYKYDDLDVSEGLPLLGFVS